MIELYSGWTTTQGAGSLSGRSFGRFGAAPGEKRGAHGIHSCSVSGMGAGSRRPGSASTLAGHFFFHGTQAQGWHGEHGLAGGAVRFGTPPGQAGHA